MFFNLCRKYQMNWKIKTKSKEEWKSPRFMWAHKTTFARIFADKNDKWHESTRSQQIIPVFTKALLLNYFENWNEGKEKLGSSNSLKVMRCLLFPGGDLIFELKIERKLRSLFWMNIWGLDCSVALKMHS